MTTATETWPTLDELRQVDKALSPAIEQVERLKQRLASLADMDTAPSVREGVPWPTLADVGALTWIVEIVKGDIGLLEEYLGDIRNIRDAAGLDSQEPGDGR